MAGGEDLFYPLCAPYVLTALEGSELSQFEAHVEAGCARCAEEIIDLAKVAGLLAAAVPQVSPSAELRERILFSARLSTVARGSRDSSRVTDTPVAAEATTARPARRWLPAGIILAGAVILVGTGLFIRSLLTSIDDHENYIKTLQRHIALLKSDAESKEGILKGIEAHRVDIVTLDGSAVNPFGFGKVIWDPETKGAMVQASNLPPPPDGSEYQLWTIRGEKQVSAGVLELLNRREQQSYYRVPPIDVGELREIGAFSITLEPKGGSGQPTGEVYLTGKPSAKDGLPSTRGTNGAP
jgi:anti-sigma-K factor RskA